MLRISAWAHVSISFINSGLTRSRNALRASSGDWLWVAVFVTTSVAGRDPGDLLARAGCGSAVKMDDFEVAIFNYTVFRC